MVYHGPELTPRCSHVGGAAEIPAATEDEMIFYVNEDRGVGAVSPDLASLRRIAMAIEDGGNGFSGTPLHTQIANAYLEGASFLLSADLEQLTSTEDDAEILGNLKYMVIGQKQDDVPNEIYVPSPVIDKVNGAGYQYLKSNYLI